MDIDANVGEAVKLAKYLLNGTWKYEEAERLAELVGAMDEWLEKGGMYPKRWRRENPEESREGMELKVEEKEGEILEISGIREEEEGKRVVLGKCPCCGNLEYEIRALKIAE
jgi:hypothetical protein